MDLELDLLDLSLSVRPDHFHIYFNFMLVFVISHSSAPHILFKLV